jgi:hypothetical protein
MKMAIKASVIGNVVEEYKLGNTTIKICDDGYRNLTPADIERTLERIVEIGWKIVHAARKAGKNI